MFCPVPLGSVVDPNRLCLDPYPDPVSLVHSDPDPNRIRIQPKLFHFFKSLSFKMIFWEMNFSSQLVSFYELLDEIKIVKHKNSSFTL